MTSLTFPSMRLQWGAALAVWCLSGCTLAPVYERPQLPVAQQWPTTTPASVATDSVDTTGLQWEEFIIEPRLRALVALALEENRDLRLAVLAVRQAQAQYQIRSADQLPTLQLGAMGTRQPKTDGSGQINSSYSVGVLSTAWEIDFFGRIASLKEAALAQYLATQEGRAAAQIGLVAAVASTWLSLRTNDALLALAQRTLASREESLRLLRLRFEQGVASAIELRQAESLSAAAQVALVQQERLRSLDVNALTLLVGQPLSLAQLNTDGVSELPLGVTPVGLPSGVLVRRPDVRQAEQQLRAANAQIGAARAAFFPRIALTTSVGTASSSLSGLFQNGSWGWTLSPQALLPIFDAGRNQAGLDTAQVGRDVALAQYEKTVQVAFREVADALAGQVTLVKQLDAQQAQVAAESSRVELAAQRYRNGIANYLEVLDAERALFATHQALAQVQLAIGLNRVNLYKVLGGG